MTDTRANLVVTLPSADLGATVGAVLRVGEVELGITGSAGGCPGVYAVVRRGGTVHLGDPVSAAGGGRGRLTSRGRRTRVTAVAGAA